MRLEMYLRRGERRAFAARVSCSKSNIDRICSGTLRPSPDLAIRIVRACKSPEGVEQVALADLPGYSETYPVVRPPRPPDRRRLPPETPAHAG